MKDWKMGNLWSKVTQFLTTLCPSRTCRALCSLFSVLCSPGRVSALLFSVLCIILVIVLIKGQDSLIEEHLWNHVIRRHLPSIFLWTTGVLAIIGILLSYIDISGWISQNTPLMILLAAAIGIIPESGPHMIFVTLYAGGIVPLPVLLASCISQDGHSSLPLLAEDKKSFAVAKLLNCIIALIAGFGTMFLM